MRDWASLVLTCAFGLFLGAIFFGGLWWTVRRGVSSSQPALWFFGSLLLRTCLTLAGFYLVSGAGWERLLACLLGFGTAGVLVTRLTRTDQHQETADAPHS